MTLTLHVLEDHCESVRKLLGITQEPTRDKVIPFTQDMRNMPEYRCEDNPIETNPKFKIEFANDEERQTFNRLLGVNVTTKTKSLWFPHRPNHYLKGLKYITDEVVVPRYPIYILSKGRSETRYTAKALEEMGVPYRMVIEPAEYELYSRVIEHEKLLVLPIQYLGLNQGGIPARNFIWEHSVQNGHKAHWILDDNIDGFERWNQNEKLPITTGICFKYIEDYFDGCENVAQCGMQYSSFYPVISLHRPMILTNTRIYSCILQRNDVLPEHSRWRGKYNEDTDLSLRLLKMGYSTLLFQNFLCCKKTTLSVAGGNTEIYSGDGLQKKLDSLLEQHPDVTKATYKFGKVHHQVNYKSFKSNAIVYKDVSFPIYPDMKLVSQ